MRMRAHFVAISRRAAFSASYLRFSRPLILFREHGVLARAASFAAAGRHKTLRAPMPLFTMAMPPVDTRA